MNQLAFQRRLLYKLKRDYGVPVSFYIQGQEGQSNLETGQRATTQTSYTIDQAIVAPLKFFEQGIYSQAFLKADRQYAFGGFLSQDWRFIIVDEEDLPSGLEITPKHHFVYAHKRYEVFSVQQMPEGFGYVITAKRLTGVETDEVTCIPIYQTLRIAHNATINKLSAGSRIFLVDVTQTFTMSGEATNEP